MTPILTILFRAKNEASSTFNRIKTDVNKLNVDTVSAMRGMNAAQDAFSQAMRGDLVGAARSAATAFKALWATMIAHPLIALAAAAAAAGVVIYKLIQHHRDAVRAAAEHRQAIQDLRDGLDNLVLGDTVDRIRAASKELEKAGDKSKLKDKIGEANASIEQMLETARTLIDYMAKMDPDSKEYKRLEKKLERMKDHIREQKQGIREYEAALGRIEAAEKKIADARRAENQRRIDELGKAAEEAEKRELQAAAKTAEEKDKLLRTEMLDRAKDAKERLSIERGFAEQELEEKKRVYAEAKKARDEAEAQDTVGLWGEDLFKHIKQLAEAKEQEQQAALAIAEAETKLYGVKKAQADEAEREAEAAKKKQEEEQKAAAKKAEAERKAAEQAEKAAKAEEKRRKESIARLNGERAAEAFSKVDTPDGFQIRKAVATATATVGVRAGMRPDIERAGRGIREEKEKSNAPTKGQADKTNNLLGEILEKVS